MVGAEAGIDEEEAAHAAQKQSGADQQHEGERHLGDHQRAAGEAVAAGGCGENCDEGRIAGRTARTWSAGMRPVSRPMTVVMRKREQKRRGIEGDGVKARQARTG